MEMEEVNWKSAKAASAFMVLQSRGDEILGDCVEAVEENARLIRFVLYLLMNGMSACIQVQSKALMFFAGTICYKKLI